MDRSCCTPSQMLLWSFWDDWAKSVVKVFLDNCLPELSYTTAFPNSRHPAPKALTAFIVFCLLVLMRNKCIIIIYIYSMASHNFLHLILFSLTCWMEMVFICKFFMRYSNICNFGWKHSYSLRTHTWNEAEKQLLGTLRQPIKQSITISGKAISKTLNVENSKLCFSVWDRGVVFVPLADLSFVLPQISKYCFLICSSTTQ